MRAVSFEQFRTAADSVGAQAYDQSYLLSYREFLAYFASRAEITEHDFIIGAHFVYGWMPTILALKRPPTGFAAVVSVLNRARHVDRITKADLILLRDVVNNSLVGSSKILHFVRPDRYAIWDSRVFRFVNGRAPYAYEMANPELFLVYLANCDKIISNGSFESVHEGINAKIGYPVSALRAIEWVMYMCGGMP